MYEIVEAYGGGWIVLCNGYQIGGNVDRSGAGDAVYSTRIEAAEAIAAARGEE